MKEDRLNGLALMYMHRDIKIDVEEIIDEFANIKKHRLEFII